jgi:hypothetical protein
MAIKKTMKGTQVKKLSRSKKLEPTKPLMALAGKQGKF